MRKNSAFIKDSIAQKRNRANEIINLCKTEVRNMTEDEETEVNSLKDEIRGLKRELQELQDEVEKMALIEEDEEVIVDEENRSEDEPQDESHEEPQEEEKSCEDENKEEEKSTRNKTTHNIMNKKNFSLFRSIRSVIDNKPFDEIDAAVIEAGRQEMRNAGVTSDGQIALPMASESRSTITVTAEGGDVVETKIIDLLMPLRAKSVLAEAGAQFMSGLQGDVQIPVMHKQNVGFASEIADAMDGASGFTNVKLSPKRITAYVDVSRKMLLQATPDIEAAIIADLGNAIAEKIENQFFSDSSGSTDSYKGIFNLIEPTSGISTFAGLVDLEADVDDANVFGEMHYVLGNKAKAALRAMAKSSKSTELVYENGEVDGTKAYNTSNVAGKKFVYGNFNNVVVGMWGTNLLIDPYTQATKSTVRVICEAWVDVQIKRTDAFVTGELA